MPGTSTSVAASKSRRGSRYESSNPAKFNTIGDTNDFQKILSAVLLDLGVNYHHIKDITLGTLDARHSQACLACAHWQLHQGGGCK